MTGDIILFIEPDGVMWRVVDRLERQFPTHYARQCFHRLNPKKEPVDEGSVDRIGMPGHETLVEGWIGPTRQQSVIQPLALVLFQPFPDDRADTLAEIERA